MAQNCLAVKNGLFRGVFLLNLVVLSALQPGRRVLRLTFMTNLKVEGGALLSAAFPGGRNNFTAIDPAANVSEQGLIVCIKTEVAIAVVKN